MISPMVLHKRSAMPEGVRRATLNKELIRRMVNTSELVEAKKKQEIVDRYAQKLINSPPPNFLQRQERRTSSPET